MLTKEKASFIKIEILFYIIIIIIKMIIIVLFILDLIIICDSVNINLQPLSVPRYNLAATSVTNFSFFGGGQDSLGNVYTTGDYFDVVRNSWYSYQLSAGRFNLVGASIPNYIFFAGGYDGNNYYNNVDILNIATGIPSNYQLTVARAGLASASLKNLGLVFFAGGFTGLFGS